MTMEIQHLIWRIEEIRDSFHTAVFVDRDLDAAMASVDPGCVLQTASGAIGAQGTRGSAGSSPRTCCPTCRRTWSSPACPRSRTSAGSRTR
ncbi:hypothetical protein [Pseudonocardia ailaonensis]|uniref:hypothetical protein n=1 Tax=Pseudonocardia ailaonensis TaxID=367279 RepID=UPI0031D9E60B